LPRTSTTSTVFAEFYHFSVGDTSTRGIAEAGFAAGHQGRGGCALSAKEVVQIHEQFAAADGFAFLQASGGARIMRLIISVSGSHLPQQQGRGKKRDGRAADQQERALHFGDLLGAAGNTKIWLASTERHNDQCPAAEAEDTEARDHENFQKQTCHTDEEDTRPSIELLSRPKK